MESEPKCIENIMSKLDINAASFQLGFEKFLIGCEATEAESNGKWDRETYGEMQDYYASLMVSIILRTISADGWVSNKEVEYLNKLFGFDYNDGELEQVFESCKELIASESFEEEIADSIRLMASFNEKLTQAYKNLLTLVCDIVAKSDGFVTDEEKAEISHIEKLLEQ